MRVDQQIKACHNFIIISLVQHSIPSKTFSRHAIPDVATFDNELQFPSAKFSNVARKRDVMHRTSSPYHSQGNEIAEAAVNEGFGSWKNAFQLNRVSISQL